MKRDVRQAFVGAGANLGDRSATLHAAADRLRAIRGIFGVTVSPVYETDPVGIEDQPMFLNAVFGVQTSLAPEELLAELQQIEQAFGRVRTVKWGPRTLDLDLLAYEGETRDRPELMLPHPRLAERAFVLVPLRDVLATATFNRAVWNPLREWTEALGPTTGVRPFDSKSGKPEKAENLKCRNPKPAPS